MSINLFTFHNVSINTTCVHLRYVGHWNLHSTMFLLILTSAKDTVVSVFEFTFHNVSINTIFP